VLELRAPGDEAELEAALALRERVFCGEQGVSPEADRDGRDPEALHVVAVEHGHVVGTCRLLMEEETARLGRMAVDRGARGKGLGAALLAEAERRATEAGARRVMLHAQERARSLYARGGYQPVGEPFMEEGLPHIAMEKTLA